MTSFASLDDLDPRGRTVLVRADLNVPVKDGRVSDTTRIDRLVPTLTDLIDRGAKVVLLSHFGRPKGRPDPTQSLRVVVPALAAALGRPVRFADDCIGAAAADAIAAAGPDEVVFLENLRFHPGEEANDPAFADALAALGDLYVNDAFSSAHRAHASTTALAERLPKAAGRLMAAEISALARALETPARPVAAIVGGAKISTKLDLIGNLVRRVDVLVLGGGMANTFLAADGVAIGRSLCEADMLDTARAIARAAADTGCTLILPVDGVVADTLAPGGATATVPLDAVPAERMILDIGPASVARIADALAPCRTLVWNGPLGAFETPPFDAGTVAVARIVADRTTAGELLSVAGGGDTVAALATAGVGERLSYLSTAGGAFLEWLEGKDLPGVAALRTAPAAGGTG